MQNTFSEKSILHSVEPQTCKNSDSVWHSPIKLVIKQGSFHKFVLEVLIKYLIKKDAKLLVYHVSISNEVQIQTQAVQI